MKNTLLFIVLLLGLGACKSYSEDDKESFDQEIQAYLTKKNIHCQRSSSGLYYRIENAGKGKTIQFHDYVSFRYKGYFLNGEQFDNEVEPVQFQVKELIPAWKEIMLELKPSSRVYMVVPPHLGYGNQELDDIPANSILVFELEVIDAH